MKEKAKATKAPKTTKVSAKALKASKGQGISPDKAGAVKLAALIGVEPIIDRAWVSIDLDKDTMIDIKRGGGKATLYPLLRTLFDFNPKSKLWVFRGFSAELITERAKLKGCSVESGEIIVIDPALAQQRKRKTSQAQAVQSANPAEIETLKGQISDLTSIVSTVMSKLGGES